MNPQQNNNQQTYYPSKEVIEKAQVKDYESLYKFSIENREEFWAQQAETLEWEQKWDKVLDSSDKPFFKWFVGGKTNIIHNAIDRHLKTWRRNKLAYIWIGEPGDVRTFSYYALNREVSKLANVLKSMGVRRGDIVRL